MTETGDEPSFSAEDLRYLGQDYRMLEALCRGRSESVEWVREAITAGQLPAPTYVLPDGTQLFTPDFFALLDSAGGIENLPNHFAERHRLATAAVRSPTSDTDDEWRNYLSGLYGACLRQVTPEAMVEKERLIWRIDTLTASARPDDPAWLAELTEAVDSLDALERPFTDHDRQSWGGTSRDSHITAVRARYLG